MYVKKYIGQNYNPVAYVKYNRDNLISKLIGSKRKWKA